MEPNSVTLVVVLLALAVAALVGVVRLRPIALKVAGGLVAVLMSVTAGVAIVNDYYGYYQTWSQLSADLSGSYASFDGPGTAAQRRAGPVRSGQLQTIELHGPRSSITRGAYVYLPPQYFQPAFAHTTFPVLELVHGTPGTPANWLVQLHVRSTLDRMIAHRLMGPVIAVMPTMSVGRHFEECVDAPGALDDTYLTEDVRTVVLARYRASAVPAEWGIAGFSSGGYCAANLALRHPASFGASGIMDGYFRPTDGPAADALHHDVTAEQANDPLAAARRLGLGARPLPSFWVAAGTADAADIAAARAFTDALHGVERVALYREPGAAHNFDAWRPAVPRMLTWMWTQLAPPALRVQFPVSGRVTRSTIAAPPGCVRSPQPAFASRP